MRRKLLILTLMLVAWTAICARWCAAQCGPGGCPSGNCGQPVPAFAGAGNWRTSSPSPAARPARQTAGARTRNFIMQSGDPALDRQLADAAEQWRRVLAVAWFGKPFPDWAAPCTMRIRVGSNLGGGGRTDFHFGDIVNGVAGEPFGFRSSIQGSREQLAATVIPHEIQHMLNASHFRRPIPRWIDEGMAVNCESHAEREKHRRMLDQFLRTGRGIPFATMLSLDEYPADFMPLYAQGFSAVEFLLTQGGLQKFVGFVEDGMKSGWRSALEKHYELKTLGEYQDKWVAWFGGSRASRPGGRAATVVASAGAPDFNAEASLLVFTGPNCPPCEAMQPTVDQLQSEGYRVWRYSVDRDTAMAQRMRVRATPTFVLLVDGREVDRIVGRASKQRLVAKWPRRAAKKEARKLKVLPVAPDTHRDSVVRISTADRGGVQSHGSGVAVYYGGRTLVLTAEHVVQDAQAVRIVTPSGVAPARVLAADRPWDIAVLEPTEPIDLESVALAEGDAATLQPGQTLEVIGFGGIGQPRRTVRGRFVAYRERTANDPRQHWLEMAGDMRPGDSGAPIFNADGDLVGIMWGSKNGEIQGFECRALNSLLASVAVGSKRVAQTRWRPIALGKRHDPAERLVPICRPRKTPPAPPTVIVDRDPEIGPKLDVLIQNTTPPPPPIEPEAESDGAKIWVVVLIGLVALVLAGFLFYRGHPDA